MLYFNIFYNTSARKNNIDNYKAFRQQDVMVVDNNEMGFDFKLQLLNITFHM